MTGGQGECRAHAGTSPRQGHGGTKQGGLREAWKSMSCHAGWYWRRSMGEHAPLRWLLLEKEHGRACPAKVAPCTACGCLL